MSTADNLSRAGQEHAGIQQVTDSGAEGSESDRHTDRESLEEEYRIVITCVVVGLIIFTSLGNLSTILAVKTDRRLRTISNMYIASLASADLMVGSFVMSFMLLYTVTFDGRWVFGYVMCDVWNYVDFVACTASLTNVCLIASDRYITVSQPLRAIHIRTRRKAIRNIAVAWAIPSTVWLGIIIALRVVNGRPPEGSCYLIWYPAYTALITAALLAYLPLLIILALFFTILFLLQRHMSGMSLNLSRRSSLQRHSTSTEDDASVKSGGISFNPRFSLGSTLFSHTKNIALLPLSGLQTNPECRSRYGQHCVQVQYVESAAQTMEYVNCSVQTMETAFSEDGKSVRTVGTSTKSVRTVGTSTSPERFGLVRTIATNTSPSLSEKRAEMMETFVDSVSMDDIPPSIVSSTTRSIDTSSTTTHDFSACSDIDSDVDLESLPPERRWRLRYASLLRQRRETSVERSHLKQQLKAAKTLGLIMTFLLVCWLPFSILWPIKTYCQMCILPRTYDVTIWINYVNSAINPIIYCLCNPRFRKAFQRIFSQRCRANRT